MKSIGIFAVICLIATLQLTLANKIRTCYSCQGINCMRTSLAAEQQCTDPLDYCVTVFDKFNVVQKGCSYQIPESLRRRCDANTVECHKCNTDRCNNLGQEKFKCIQCDSSKDANCASTAAGIEATRCTSPSAPNSYCYVKYDGGTTKRGCSTTVAEQQSCFADANCLLCMTGDIAACNSVNFTPGTRANQL